MPGSGVASQMPMAVAFVSSASPRDRKRIDGKVEGRKSHAEKRPDVVLMVKRLYRASPKTGERRSFREVITQLAKFGFVNERGKPYHAQSVQRMIESTRPKIETLKERPAA